MIEIILPGGGRVPARLDVPPAPFAACSFAHGAGAGMDHPFMAAMAAGLARRGVATLRFQFPFMARGGKRPDPPAVAQATVRAALDALARELPALPRFAAGKSFGGRMGSQAEAERPLGVHGLVFVGFPLHPAGKPSTARARHLEQVAVPMLFLQGTRDALADDALLTEVVARLGARAMLHREAEADHAFHVPRRSGRDDAAVLESLCEEAARWMRARLEGRGR